MASLHICKSATIAKSTLSHCAIIILQSAGLVICVYLFHALTGSIKLRRTATPVIAIVSERLHSRRGVMIAGQFALVASQLLLMEASKFWVMCLGRLFEGISSAIILVAGLALMYVL